MHYNSQINTALQICYAAHSAQLDKSNVPYVFHPFAVATTLEEPTTTNEIITALLHDVFEDNPEIIKKDWFNNFYVTLDDEVKEALNLLTHDKSISYDTYIFGISQNKIATKVKYADLCHNMILSRLDKLTTDDMNRYMKYQKALSYLRDRGTWD